MKYIDKNQQPQVNAFNAMIDSFIAHGKVHYRSLDDGERNQIKIVLSAEQQSHCAFCMQRPQQGGTVEHVIPQGITQRNYPAALRKGDYRNDFIHQSSFNVAYQPRQYPHTLAYGNLVLSCNSCNAQKWDEVISPTFFNDPTGVSYLEDGRVQFPTNALSLNLRTYLNGQTFTKYRALWQAIKQAGYGVADVYACSRITERQAMLDNAEPHMRGTLRDLYQQNKRRFLSNNSWDMMLSFDWFWSVY